MPALTEADILEHILVEVGDVDPLTGDPATDPSAGLVAGQIDYLWARWAAKDQVAGGLRELYVKRDAVEMILTVLIPRRIDVSDVRAGLHVRGDNIVAGYERKMARYIALIAATEKAVGAGVSAGFRIGQLRTQSPVQTDPCLPNPSALRYGGLPGTRLRVRPNRNIRR